MAIITAGSAAILRDGSIGNNRTVIGFNGAADGTGTITSIQIYLTGGVDSGLLTRMGVFAPTGGANFICRSWELVGVITSGSTQTIPVNLAVVIGDYIGFYLNEGTCQRQAAGGNGMYWLDNDQTEAGEQTFTLSAARILSLYGTGVTLSKGGNFIPRLIAMGQL